jgi:hypothetical protein
MNRIAKVKKQIEDMSINDSVYNYIKHNFKKNDKEIDYFAADLSYECTIYNNLMNDLNQFFNPLSDDNWHEAFELRTSIDGLMLKCVPANDRIKKLLNNYYDLLEKQNELDCVYTSNAKKRKIKFEKEADNCRYEIIEYCEKVVKKKLSN